MSKFLVIAILALAAGCASTGPQDYARSEARVVQTVAYGTVESVRPVRLAEDRPIVGTIAGAAIGGLLGNSIGHGNGRAAATVIGAVGGGIAGNAIERNVSGEDGQEIVIRLDSGSTIAVVQPGIRGFEPASACACSPGRKARASSTAKDALAPMGEVTAAIFRDGEVIDRPALDASMPQYGESAFTWIEALDPVDSDFAVLQERFGLHSLAVKDAMSPAQVPKVDVYEDQIFVVLKIARLEGDEIKYAGIDAFVSRQHIITVRHGDAAAHVHAREKLRSGSRLRPDFVLHAIMDSVANGYFPVVEMVEHEVLSMEQHLLDSFLGRDEITRLFRLRREAIHLQHVLARMSDLCGKLANLEVPRIGAEAKPYLISFACKEVLDEGDRGDGPGCGNGRDEARGAARAGGSDKRRRRSGSCLGIHLG